MNMNTLHNVFLASIITALSTFGSVAQGAEDGNSSAELPDLNGTNWQLVRLTVLGGFVFTPEDPSKYVINFRSENRLTGASDCNTLRGSWHQVDSALNFEPFSSSRKLCSPGSLHNNLVLYLRDTVTFEIVDGNMIVNTTTEGVAIEFEVR